MSEQFPPPLSARETAELRRRQRVRNWGMLIALCLLAALFYAIAMVKMKVP